MPYISLYRKYRSQTFEDVVGQDHVVRTIRNAIKAGRTAHGYLFCGSRGTGKTTVARLIAKALNCAEGPTPTPCNKCEACVSITAGAAVDVIEMDAASNRSVDDVDALREGVKYPPMRLRYKVYIIDEAHQLSIQAKDAFLKTLEEPPPHAVFILATTESHKIPITIRSRCQQFDFRRGTVEEISDRLRYVTTAEQTEIDDDAIELLARSANGSYRDSLSLLEQVLAYTEGKVTAGDVNTVLGMVDEEVLLELGEVLAARDTAAVFSLADRLMREGRDARELLRSAAGHFRDLLAFKVGASTRHRGDDRWRAQAEDLSEDRLVRIIDELSAAEKELRWNDQHRLGLELALLKSMARPAPPEASASAAAARRPSAPAKRAPAKAAEPDSEKAAVEQGAPVHEPARDQQEVEASGKAMKDSAPEPAASPTALPQVKQNWEKILRHLQKVLKQASVAALAREGQPVELSDSVLTVGFSKRHSFHQAGTQQNAGKLSQAIQEVLGVQLKVVTVIVDDLPAQSSGGNAVSGGGREAESAQHPLLDDVLTKFDGTVVDGDDDPWEEQT